MIPILADACSNPDSFACWSSNISLGGGIAVAAIAICILIVVLGYFYFIYKMSND
jgi:hypothetical protein